MSANHKYHPTKKRLATSTQLRFYKHHTFPLLNQCIDNDVNDAEDALSFFNNFPYKFECPLPLLLRNEICRPAMIGFNATLELAKKKYQWKQKKKSLVTKLNASMKKYNSISSAVDIIKNNPDFVSRKQPCSLAALGHHLSKNPDKYFKGIYNWYFGNCITFAHVNGKQFLLSVCGNNLNEIAVSRFKVKKIKHNNKSEPISVNPCSVLSVENEELVYDIVSSKTSGIIGIRQRNLCSFIYLDENEDNYGLNIKRCLSVTNVGYPFVSMDVKNEEFCTVSLNGDLKLWAPEYSKKSVLKSSVPHSKFKNSDKFTSAKYSMDDENMISLVNRSTAFCYDKRVGLDNPSSSWFFHKQSEICEEISLILPSINSNFWYIALTHSVFLLDTRKGLVQKWAHMFPYSPSTGYVQKISSGSNEDELLFLSGHSGNEVVCIYNNWTVNEVPRSTCVPLSIPNRMDTLLSARSNGLCLDPLITCRFERSIIGLVGYKKKTQVGLLTSTVLGDVFHQNIRPNDDDDNDDISCSVSDTANVTRYLNAAELDYLSKWENENCFEPSIADRNTIHCTKVVDLKEIYDQIDIENVNDSRMDFENDIVTSRESWSISKKKVESYNDLLAANIVDDFGIREMSDWGSFVESESGDEINLPDNSVQYDKVKNWLNRGRSVENTTTRQNEDSVNLNRTDNGCSSDDDVSSSNDLSVSATS